jgi:hypothetical protein
MTPRQSAVHWLKLNQEYYIPILSGSKTFEIRKNDRDYQVGDTVVLEVFEKGSYKREFSPIRRTIKYMTDYQQRKGYVVFSI